MVAADNGSAILVFSPSFDPFSYQTKAFVATLRTAIAGINAQHGPLGITFWLYHPMIVETDAEADTLSRFPVAISIGVVVLFVIASKFRYALVPIKLAVTVIVPTWTPSPVTSGPLQAVPASVD